MAQRRSLYGIPDMLWRRAKAAAAGRGISLSDWIGEAIEEKLNNKKGDAMQSYAIFDNHSGLLFGIVEADNSVKACKEVDQDIGEHGREYEEKNPYLGLNANDTGYIVYEITDSEFYKYKNADGQDQDVIEAITEDRDPIAAYLVSRPSDWE